MISYIFTVTGLSVGVVCVFRAVTVSQHALLSSLTEQRVVFFFFYTGLFEGLVDFAAKFKAIYIYTPVVILVSLFEVAINACLDSTGRFGKPASAADN